MEAGLFPAAGSHLRAPRGVSQPTHHHLWDCIKSRGGETTGLRSKGTGPGSQNRAGGLQSRGRRLRTGATKSLWGLLREMTRALLVCQSLSNLLERRTGECQVKPHEMRTQNHNFSLLSLTLSWILKLKLYYEVVGGLQVRLFRIILFILFIVSLSNTSCN